MISVWISAPPPEGGLWLKIKCQGIHYACWRRAGNAGELSSSSLFSLEKSDLGNIIWKLAQQACCLDSVKSWQLSLFDMENHRRHKFTLWAQKSAYLTNDRMNSTHLQSNYQLWYQKMRSSVAFQQCSPEIVWQQDFVIEVKIFEWEWGSSSSVHLHFYIFSQDQMFQYHWKPWGQRWAL